jgi:secreted trypsin-like serine protease
LKFIDPLNSTAAHCIQDKNDDYRRQPSEIVVYFGVYDLKKRNGRRLEISEIVIHPDWKVEGEIYDGDIAVLRLRDGVKLSRYRLHGI